MIAEPIRLVIADDHPAFRAGLRALLESLNEFSVEIVGEAESGEQALQISIELAPDVVVMDLHMPGAGGIETTRQLTTALPHASVLILTMLDDDDSLFAALRAGARGYILKGAGQEQLARAIGAVAAGESIFDAAIAARVIDAFSNSHDTQSQLMFPELTAREQEVLDLLAGGRSNSDIAAQLGLSSKTVRNHVSNILGKLHARDRAAAVVRAREAGLGQ